MRPPIGGRHPAWRAGRALTFLACAVAALAALAGCTAGPPRVLPQGPGQGIDPDAAVAPSAGCTSAPYGEAQAPGTTSSITLVSGGVTRRSLLSLPAAPSGDPGAGPRPAPLLVSLHPFTLDAPVWEGYSGLAEAATARGYVVLSPTGSDPGPRWAVPGGLETGARDIEFVADLVDHVAATLCIDLNSVYAAGFSAGAAMAQALSCTMPWRFAAVAGSGGVNLTDLCPDSPPTDVLVLHGTVDPIAPPSGSVVPFAPPLGIPVDEVTDTNAARAGCDQAPLATQPAPGVEARVFTGCDAQRRVEQWNMVGAGHTWAGAEPVPFDLVVGPTATGFSANDVVLDFFDGT
ncbi:MAG: PHB depolymerase family esterase [Microthrixaceae bacterium]